MKVCVRIKFFRGKQKLCPNVFRLFLDPISESNFLDWWEAGEITTQLELREIELEPADDLEE